MHYLTALICLLAATVAGAAEGMWTLDNLPKAELKTRYGFEPTQNWADKAMRASVRLAQGCSGSFISPNGLAMTNHHCAMRCIEQLSSADRNYLRDGYLATTRDRELKCPELEFQRLEKIQDVTAEVKAATQGKSGETFKSAINAVRARLSSACVAGDKSRTHCEVVELYRGGLYHLYRYHRFQDVRVAWAPEQGIAFFGGDPDNFNFPRYDLDATFLRAYEGGKPAKIKDYFRFKAAGAEEGELVFTLGHPGSTQRELTTAQLTTLRDRNYLRELQFNSELRGMLEQYRKSGAEAARVAAGDLFSLENTIKARRGAMAALQDPELLRDKQWREAALQSFVTQRAELTDAKNAWSDVARAEAVYRDIDVEYFFLESGRGFFSKYFTFARALVRGAAERAKPDAERLPEYSDAKLPSREQSLFSTAPIYPDYEKVKLAWSLTKLREWLGADDALVRQLLGRNSPEQVAASLVDGTQLGDPAVRKAWWNDSAALAASNDPFVRFAAAVEPAARALRERYDNEVDAVGQRAGQAIAAARFAQLGASVAPDATFTLRLSYGEVRGWTEAGQAVPPFTDIDGAFGRHTGVDPFALPDSWLKNKERLVGAKRLNFVTTNDIIGGNSGSPVVNRNAEIVGLVFDGNIHSLGGGFWYDERVNRAVAVHPAVILESLSKLYGADHLVKELAPL